MRWVFTLLFVFSLQGANTFYVANSGNDANDGLSTGAQWKTVAHALDKTAMGTLRCGDTLIVDATSAPAGSAVFPYFDGCGQTTTIQTSRLSTFLPAGYRTNPVRDTGNYGKMTFVTGGEGLGWKLSEETRGQNQDYSSWCNFTLSGSTFTSSCSYGTWNLIDGSKIVFDTEEGLPFPAISAPAPLAFSTHYFVVNSSCVMSAGSLCPNGTTFQLAATSGGAPITITACNSDCLAHVIFWEPVATNTSTSTLTVPQAFVSIANGTPVTLVSSGHTIVGTIPAPLQVDTIYYVINLSGINFQLAATLGGAPITLTTPGTGVVSIASIQVPNNWAFRGLEFSITPTNFIYGMLVLGRGGWTSALGAVSHIEVDRCYFHGNDNTGEDTLIRSIVENGSFIYIHDSYLSGNTASESQAINGVGSPGPVVISNNFLEAAGEITLYGGGFPTAPAANTDHKFFGNYFYKPPKWKFVSNTGAASGACLYDTTDPLRSGGEFYTDTMTGTKYACGSDGMWAVTGATAPTFPITVKNCWEHKNGRYFSLIGNLINYCITSSQFMALNISQEAGSGPGISDDHIVVQNNKLFNFYQFMSRRSDCSATATVLCIYFPAQHYFINNLAVHNPASCGVLFTTGTPTCDARAAAFQGLWLAQNIASLLPGDLSDHNTIYVPDSTPFTGYTPMFVSQLLTGGCTHPTIIDYESFTNNINVSDFGGDCGGTGGNVITNYYTHFTGKNNALKGGNSSGYGTVVGTNSWTNAVYPADNTVIKYVSATGDISGDYHLDPTSPYSASNGSATRLSTDGSDLGADIDVINMATSGAATGTPPWDQMYHVRWQVVGSISAVLAYDAPTTDVCTITVYNSVVRIAGNVIITVADSDAASITDGLRRELLVTGLTASTTYPSWKLACGNGVLIIGSSFTTRAAGSTLQYPFQVSSATALTYSVNKDLTSGTTLSAATTQYVPVAPGTTVYCQFTGGQLHVLAGLSATGMLFDSATGLFDSAGGLFDAH